MRRRWMGAVLVALGLVARAPAQMPGPPPGGGMPMMPPSFAGDPTPMPGPEFCPPGGGGGGAEKASPFSLPNDGSPNAFSKDDCQDCRGSEVYFSLGYMGLFRQGMGNGVIAVRDPGINLPGIPTNADTGNGPPAGAAPMFGYNNVPANFSNGVRSFLTYREDGRAVEIGGFYLVQNTSSGAVSAPGQLDLPFAAFPSPIGFQGDNFLWLQADQVRATMQTRIASAEVNYRQSYFRGFEWLVGVRYLDLRERFTITTDDDSLVLAQRGLPSNPTQIASVSAVTHSHIVAPQLGFEWERPLVSWASVGLTGKAAWGANLLQTDTGLMRGDGFLGPSSQHNGIYFSHLYELAAWGTIALTEQCRLKAGYQALWLVNVPQPQQQINFDLGNPGGAHSNTSSIFYHGPTVEIQFAF